MSRNKKYWQYRFGEPYGKTQSYYHHLDLRNIDELDDEGFAYLMAGIKGVNMLDLNETEITNESIRLITTFEYIKELRAKGCHLLNDNCVTDLNKITSLEFLHLRNTAIMTNGLLKLSNLTNLKTLMFSADDIGAIKEKLIQLKIMLPQCDLVIDSKPYYFDAVELFVRRIKEKPYKYRLKIKNQASDAVWSKWLIQPSDSYIESEMQGPCSINDIEWVEIDSIEKKNVGKLVPEKEIDHSTEVIKLLEYLTFPFMVTDGIISVYLIKKEL
jgi:hypothetical protein